MAETVQLTLDPKTLIQSHHFDPLNPSNTLQLITDPYFMERGPRYNAYAQLRESKLRSKRLKFEEDEQVLEIPRSKFSPAKKIPRYQGNMLGNSKKIEEDEQFLEIPRSEFSPAKKIVRFQGNLLRNSKKIDEDEQFLELPKSEFSPAKKSVRFQGNLQGNSKKQGYSALAQSVPDFSSALRKENRKPPSENRIPRFEKSATPPPLLSKREKMYGSGTKLGGVGSKSVNSGEKQSSGKLMMMGRKSYASIDELKGLSIAAANAINGENRGVKKGGSVLRKSTVFSTRYY